MFSSKANLTSELLSFRKKEISDELLLNEVYEILNKNQEKRNQIKNNLSRISSTNHNSFKFELLETGKIFHLNQIKKLCIDFRLRFLDSNLFNNEIPEEAISIINDLEKKHNTTLEGFKIIAPSKAFNLKSYDDPLLFVPIGNNYYYLVHKWGNDLNAFRKIKYLPIKNIVNFVLFSVLLSAIGTYFTPETNLSKSVEFAQIIIFLFMFKSIVVTIAYYFFMMGKNFNSEIWNRPFKEN
jgi:heme/copper-type cytochrome/quinol oxidase subunit 4